MDELWLMKYFLLKQPNLKLQLSHLRNIGDTFDYAYGFDDVSYLAKTQPKKSAFNADSYLWYVSMPSF